MGEVSAREGDGLGATIGIEYLEGSADRVRARAPVSDTVRQPAGVVHGGAYAAIAESICSRMTRKTVAEDGMVALGQSNHATFLYPIHEGYINAEAWVRHRGRTTWIWDCELTDDEGRLCAIARITIAVRPRRD